MKTQMNYAEMLVDTERFAPKTSTSVCEMLGERVTAIYNELDNLDLTPRQSQALGVELRALLKEMNGMDCPIPVRQ